MPSCIRKTFRLLPARKQFPGSNFARLCPVSLSVARHGKLPPRRQQELPPPRLAEESKDGSRTNHWKPVVDWGFTGASDEDAGRCRGNAAAKDVRVGH